MGDSESKPPWVLIYSAGLLAVIFYAVRRLFFEWTMLWTTNIPWVQSFLRIAAVIFVGLLAILALLGVLARALLKTPLIPYLVGISTKGRFRVYRERRET